MSIIYFIVVRCIGSRKTRARVRREDALYFFTIRVRARAYNTFARTRCTRVLDNWTRVEVNCNYCCTRPVRNRTRRENKANNDFPHVNHCQITASLTTCFYASLLTRSKSNIPPSPTHNKNWATKRQHVSYFLCQ